MKSEKMTQPDCFPPIGTTCKCLLLLYKSKIRYIKFSSFWKILVYAVIKIMLIKSVMEKWKYEYVIVLL